MPDAPAIPLTPALRVHEFSVELPAAFGEWRSIVSDVSFSLNPGLITGLLGESGSGKTTLALGLLDLLPGRYRIRGTVERPRGGRRHAAIIFQDPLLALNPVLTVRRQVEEVVRAHGQTHTVESLLELAGLAPAPRILGAYPHQLSGGERQRVAIAQALASHPDVIVADEPFTALDVVRVAELAALFRELCVKTGISFLLISHSPEVLRALCGWVLVMQAGRIVEEGPPERILRSPTHPYTASLIQPLPARKEAGPLPAGEPVLRVEGLTKTYSRPPNTALRGVSLCVERGRVLGIVGRSGSGKSTLARCMARQETPSGGAVYLEPGTVQLIQQQPAAGINPRFTAGETVAEPLAIQGRDRTARSAAAAHWMETVGLRSADAQRPALHFSGGERQRLAIARALSVEPRLLILDESFSGLDRNLQGQLAHLLLDLQRLLPLTLILISHDLTLVARMADEVAVLEEGVLVEQGPAAQILESPVHPATRALLAASLTLQECG